MDRMYRKVQLSCDIFWGYNTMIDLTNPGIKSRSDIIHYILNNLRGELIKMNMDVLREKLDEKYHNYHIHDGDNIDDNNFINNLKRSPRDDVIYVCRHEH
jgi:hypothetical protein